MGLGFSSGFRPSTFVAQLPLSLTPLQILTSLPLQSSTLILQLDSKTHYDSSESFSPLCSSTELCLQPLLHNTQFPRNSII